MVFPHRAVAAFLAISVLCSGVNLAARAGPPFLPPSLPRATAAGFFPVSASISLKRRSASKSRSVFLERLGTALYDSETRRNASKNGVFYVWERGLPAGLFPLPRSRLEACAPAAVRRRVFISRRQWLSGPQRRDPSLRCLEPAASTPKGNAR